MTVAQRRGFKELSESGRANTLEEHTRIAYDALIAGGADDDLAQGLMKGAIDDLVEQGVYAPTRIPWYSPK